MRTIFTFLLGMAAVAVLLAGYFHWHQRIEASTTHIASAAGAPESAAATSQAKTDDSDLISYTRNWPKSAADRFQQTLKENKPFKILFVGSPAFGTDTTGAYPVVKKKLLDTFGAKHIEVNLKTYKTTTKQFVNANKQAEIASEKADFVIFEPFILLNNGEVLIEDTLANVSKIIADVQAKNPNTTFALQPSYPLYKAKIYPAQVAELKKYAAAHHITYLDHWTAWPNQTAPAFKEYLTPDQSAPSEKGYQVWSDYLIHYLIHN